jgi:hypothetical protein
MRGGGYGNANARDLVHAISNKSLDAGRSNGGADHILHSVFSISALVSQIIGRAGGAHPACGIPD